MARASPTAATEDGNEFDRRHRRGRREPDDVWTTAQGETCSVLSTTTSTWSPDGRPHLPDQPGVPRPARPVHRADRRVVTRDRLLTPALQGLYPRFVARRQPDRLPGPGGRRQHRLLRGRVGRRATRSGGLQARQIGPDLGVSPVDQWLRRVVARRHRARGRGLFDTDDIVVVKPDGSAPRVVAQTRRSTRVVAGRQARSPSTAWWNHRSICRTARARHARLGRSNADGTNERRLEPLVEGCVLPPMWSPDGTRLAGLLIVPHRMTRT